MVRKFLSALVVLGLLVGSMFAEEIRGAFIKFADGTLTLRVDDKEKDFKIPAELKMKIKGKDGNEIEQTATEVLNRFNKSKFKPNLVVTVEGDKVTGVKFGGKKGAK